jgi:hypothetical protein
MRAETVLPSSRYTNIEHPVTHTSKRPRIGIPIPTLAQTEYNQRTWPQYAAAVAEAGGGKFELLDPIFSPLSRGSVSSSLSPRPLLLCGESLRF